MPITYANRKGTTYTLCRETTKTGKPRYMFVRDPAGRQVADHIPEGWEIRESVNGIVSLARERVQKLRPGEVAAVEAAVREHPKARNYRVDIKADRIVVYESMGPDVDDLISDFMAMGMFPNAREAKLRELLEDRAQFSPILRFILEDEETRVYRAERWCFLGGIDDWILVTAGPVEQLARRIVPTLGSEAFFEW